MLTLALVSAATNEVTGLTNTYNLVSPWLVYLACTILISTMVASLALWSGKARSATVARSSAPPSSHDAAGRASLVRALVERRSVFPRDYARGHGREVPREVVDSMLEELFEHGGPGGQVPRILHRGAVRDHGASQRQEKPGGLRAAHDGVEGLSATPLMYISIVSSLLQRGLPHHDGVGDAGRELLLQGGLEPEPPVEANVARLLGGQNDGKPLGVRGFLLTAMRSRTRCGLVPSASAYDRSCHAFALRSRPTGPKPHWSRSCRSPPRTMRKKDTGGASLGVSRKAH